MFSQILQLIARNINGNRSSASVEVTATPITHNETISASPNVGEAPLPVTFTYSFPSGQLCSIEFGDGKNEGLPACVGTISHTYSDPWTRKIKLIADDSNVGETTIRMTTRGWVGFVNSLDNYVESNENICDIQTDGRLYINSSPSAYQHSSG